MRLFCALHLLILSPQGGNTMFRILRILIITTVALVLIAPVWAGESEDVQQIRELLYKDIDGHFKGDVEQVLSFDQSEIKNYLSVF